MKVILVGLIILGIFALVGGVMNESPFATIIIIVILLVLVFGGTKIKGE